jgi:mRNA interferase RelE/StbE
MRKHGNRSVQFYIIYSDKVISDHIPAIPSANRSQIARAISERLTQNPIGHGKPLTGKLKGLWRLRVGDWRVIYEIEGSKVIIYTIGNRKDVYKRG